MSDLISRKAALNALLMSKNYRDAYNMLKQLPIVDTASVTRGQWITNKYGMVVCSECSNSALDVLTGCLANRHFEPHKSKFCPNCGAKMELE